jgi:hypothetical protein
MNEKSAILPRPMKPSLLRRCPYCRKLFVLRKLPTEQDGKVGEVRVYGCQSCGRESRYVASHPPNAV